MTFSAGGKTIAQDSSLGLNLPIGDSREKLFAHKRKSRENRARSRRCKFRTAQATAKAGRPAGAGGMHFSPLWNEPEDVCMRMSFQFSSKELRTFYAGFYSARPRALSVLRAVGRAALCFDFFGILRESQSASKKSERKHNEIRKNINGVSVGVRRRGNIVRRSVRV